AAAIAGWRYPPPYDIYDGDPDDVDGLLDRDADYRAICAGGELVGFHCIGVDAQVPGGDYAEPCLDLGMGLRPDWTGRGEGTEILRAIVAYRGADLRATVAAFNTRALRVCERVGFRAVARFHSPPSGRDFVIVRLTSARPSSSG